ncbi:MAG TPA: hypothetical protein VEK08_05155 [Planctomycetota bacterium]|nr:hypothetical protein [Planctomycetota bacterium]
MPVILLKVVMRSRMGSDEQYNLWILEALSAAVIASGLFFWLLAAMLAKSLELGKAPKHLSGERDANDGQWLAAAGLGFAVFAVFAHFALGMPRQGLIFLISASLVFTIWGAGKVVLCCGAIENAARRLFLASVTLLIVGAITALLEALIHTSRF